MSAKKNKKKSGSKILLGLGILIIIIMAYIGFYYYRYILSPNVTISGNKKQEYVLIPTGSDFNQVLNILSENNFIRDTTSFKWLAKKMNYSAHVHAGRFLIKRGMSNYDLVKMLRANANVPLKIVLNIQNTVEGVAGYVGHELEIDSTEIMEKLYDQNFLKSNQLTHDNVMTFFIPNTYEFYWNTSLTDFIKKMGREYHKFWNEAREKKAKKLNLSVTEVTILASIVEGETKNVKEMPRVAGVYLNRLRMDMKLEADPTVTWLIKTRKVYRVYKADTEIESPYNTYKYKGLPPGPIGFPEIHTIDAVLNAEEHHYLYFCAKPDNSGTHNFARTLDQHLAYARQFHRYLNKKKIK